MATRRHEMRAVLEGLEKELGGTRTLMLDGKRYTVKELQRLFRAVVDAANATDSARSRYHAAVATERRETANAERLRAYLRMALESHFGRASVKLVRFGFALHKPPRRPSTDTAASAVAKRRATRLARGTMGKNQKKRVRGT